MQGHVRDFTREVALIHQMYHLISTYHDDSQDTLVRREDRGPQSLRGCVLSALIGGAMRVQARMQRQGTNFQPQSTGAMVNKECQVAIWQEQPVGVTPWRVVPLNVHDELMATIRIKLDVSSRLYSVVERWKGRVPLIAIEWKQGVASWADK
jgi:hypothetical protein